MDATYWQKQTSTNPLYQDLLWSRPENRLQAGKLLIVGGNLHGFSAPAEAYAQAVKAGVGTARVLLPDSLQKTVGRVIENGEYAASTFSGSFSQQALATLLEHAAWADGVLLAGDFGRNSETAVMIEKFLDKYYGQLTVTQDGLDYFTKTPGKLINRSATLLVPSFAQLQKLAINVGFTPVFKFEMDLLNLVQALHDFTREFPINLLTKHLDNFLVSTNGQVSTTKLQKEQPVWRVKLAAGVAVWWLQNPSQTLAALTTGIFDSLR